MRKKSKENSTWLVQLLDIYDSLQNHSYKLVFK
jgi:hypothetical protein